jgi:hypothetical protein
MFLSDLGLIPWAVIENSNVSIESSSATMQDKQVIARVTLVLKPSEDAPLGWPLTETTERKE